MAMIPCASFMMKIPLLHCARLRRGKEKNRLTGAECRFVATELLAPPVPSLCSHRTGHHQVMRKAALRRASLAKLLRVRDYLVVAARAKPSHDALVEGAIVG